MLIFQLLTLFFEHFQGIFHVCLELKEGMKLMQLHEEDRIVSKMEIQLNITGALDTLHNFRVNQRSFLLHASAKTVAINMLDEI